MASLKFFFLQVMLINYNKLKYIVVFSTYALNKL